MLWAGRFGHLGWADQVLDAVSHRLEASLFEKVRTGDFPISTLDRILRDTYAREFFGLSTRGGAPERLLEEKETLKGLARILMDLAEGRLPVRKVYTSEQIKSYVESFEKKDTPDRRKKLSAPVALTAHEDVGVAAVRVHSRPLGHERKRLIPSGVSYRIDDDRINAIYHELRGLDVETRRNAVAVLFRVFLELSVEFYLDEHGITYHGNDKLGNKIQKVAKQMKEEGWLDRKSSKGIDSAVASRDEPHSVDTFHAFVHNRRFQPVPTALNTAWDNLQPFFEVLFSHQH